MQININGNISDISRMLVSAVRYALRRRTYITKWTCEFIENNLHLLVERDKFVMIRDIKEEFRSINDLDKKCWLRLLEILEDK